MMSMDTCPRIPVMAPDANHMILSVAQIVPVTAAEGPGKRFALWFQGCPLRCPGCCNPHMLPFAGGQQMRLEEVVADVAAAMTHGIEGITLLGGEPTAHAQSAAALARRVRSLGLSVMVFSGYTLEELQARRDPHIDDLLGHTDILVDGPYDRELPDTQRRWIGSTNQRILFLTERYSPDDPCWRRPNTLEIRLVAGEITLNGFPTAGALGTWKPARREP
jgi:anaerobic ribonucleoside-triphosphate reductase activating protein